MNPHILKHSGYSFYLIIIDCLRAANSFNVIMQGEEKSGVC
jgi:hypothetical protein